MRSAKWLFTLLPAVLASQTPDAPEIIRKSLERDLLDFERARHYTFREHTVTTKVDGKGRPSSVESQTSDIFFLYGEPYERVVKKNGKPLSPGDEKKEREKLDKLTRDREKETPGEREKRLAKYEKRRQEFRMFRQEIGKAYNFTVRGSELIHGRDAWVINAEPRAGYKGINSQSRMLPKMRGVLWVDKADHHWVKVECETLDTISFGLFLARLAKGARISFESTRVNDEVWLPKRIHVAFDARLALLKSMRGTVEQTMSNYRKFQTESRITAFGEK